MTPLKSALFILALVATVIPSAVQAQDRAQDGARDRVSIRDIAGRDVTIDRPVKRIVLGEGRQLVALSLLHPDPVSLLVAWPADLQRQDKVLYDQYRRKFPALDRVAVVGRGSEDTFSVEQALASNPDVAILSGGYGPSARSAEVIRKLEAAGIPVVFIDFVAAPLANTVPSMRILGQILGRETEAAAFIQFYESRMARIKARLDETKPRWPTVLMHAHAGLHECCNAPGRATIGAFLDAAGGSNIAADVLKQPFGQLSLEYVISRNPEVYIGTGGIHLDGVGGLVMGPGVDVNVSRARLATVVQKPGLAELQAVQNRRVHGIWHLFNNMPANVLAVEALARWLHPELIKDVDPDASLRELNGRFLPVPFEGTFWVSLQPDAGGGAKR